MSGRSSANVAGLIASVPGAGTTGGWRWHLRAARSSAQWSAARSSLASWLSAIPDPVPDRLVWVGASAGWMVPPSWVSRFSEVEVIDLDPLARPLFALRHGRLLDRAGKRWHWHRIDGLSRLDEVLDRWPDAAVFFDNLLGQQIYRHADGDALERWLGALHHRLAGRLWGSVHDWLSGPFRMRAGDVLEPVGFEVAEDPGGVRLFVTGIASMRPAERLAEWLHRRAGGHGVWQDHRTAELFPAGSRGLLIPWMFSSAHLHWLQAAWVDGRAD